MEQSKIMLDHAGLDPEQTGCAICQNTESENCQLPKFPNLHGFCLHFLHPCELEQEAGKTGEG